MRVDPSVGQIGQDQFGVAGGLTLDEPRGFADVSKGLWASLWNTVR
jgi:hypothetical protein